MRYEYSNIKIERATEDNDHQAPSFTPYKVITNTGTAQSHTTLGLKYPLPFK